VVAPPALDCAEVDPATHELWLLQMPFSVRPLLRGKGSLQGVMFHASAQLLQHGTPCLCRASQVRGQHTANTVQPAAVAESPSEIDLESWRLRAVHRFARHPGLSRPVCCAVELRPLPRVGPGAAGRGRRGRRRAGPLHRRVRCVRGPRAARTCSPDLLPLLCTSGVAVTVLSSLRDVQLTAPSGAFGVKRGPPAPWQALREAVRRAGRAGLRYRIVQEAPELARKHFAISAGRPAAAVARRVTLVAEEAFEAAAAASTAGAPMHSTGGEAIAALATEAGVTEAEVLAAARERAFGPVLHDPDTGAPVSTVSPALREAGTGAPAAAALSSRAGLDVNEKKKKKKKRRDSDSSAAGGEPGGARDGGLEQGAASPTQGRGKKQKKRMRSDS